MTTELKTHILIKGSRGLNNNNNNRISDAPNPSSTQLCTQTFTFPLMHTRSSLSTKSLSTPHQKRQQQKQNPEWPDKDTSKQQFYFLKCGFDHHLHRATFVSIWKGSIGSGVDR